MTRKPEFLTVPARFRQIVIDAETDTMDVRSNSAIYKGYEYWLAHGGQRPIRVSLCQYYWVGLFTWLFNRPVYKEVRPWQLLFFAAWMVAFVHFDHSRGNSLYWLAYVSIIWMSWIRTPIWNRIKPPIQFVWSHGPKQAITWFFQARYLQYIAPWMVTAVIGLGVAGYKLGPEKVVAIIGVLFLTLLGLLALLFAIFIVKFVIDKLVVLRHERRIRSTGYSGEARKYPGAGSAEQTARFLISKPRRICPFIRLPGDPGHPETQLQ